MKNYSPYFLVSAALCLLPSAVHAQADTAAPPPLPVRSVSLFTSGVSYTERGGMVDGNADVPLSFPTDQINDLLKSLVLIDSGGQVQPVTYGAHDPVSRTLQSFGVDISHMLSRADLLQRLRGTRVSVTPDAGSVLVGQVVGVGTRTERRADGTTIDNVRILNLLTDEGLQAINIDDARAIQILDPRLRAELSQALSVLASDADNSRRTVTLHFAGSGHREVRVGYVAEAPLWKVSYRLLVGGTGGASPKSTNYLQGWALVENTTDDDWDGIHLSLVSGRPVSFIEDLYQPLYLPRPVVPVDVIASPYPQTHGANLQEEAPRASKVSGTIDAITRGSAERVSVSEPAMAPPPPAPIAGFSSNGISPLFKQSVQAQAQGADAGEQYAYNISIPVTLPRQKAAMIPIVAQDIGGDKVLLYNYDTDRKFPLDAVRLRNTTKLHLKGGPVTLFDDGVYAGDARMEDVSPGETRLISYAVDLSVQGDRQTTGAGSLRTSLSLNRGVLTVTSFTRTEQAYAFKSQASGPRTLVIEQPYQAGDKLMQPAKAGERTSDVYRFDLPIQPGKTASLTVVTEHPQYSSITLLDADLDDISVYAEDTDISAAQRATLQSIIQARREIDTLRAAAASRKAQVASYTSDQGRIRDNMKALDKSSALYKRYADELNTQETQIQKLRVEADALSAKADAAANALRARLDTLTL